MKASRYLLTLVCVVCILFTAWTFGYNHKRAELVAKPIIEPVSEFVEFSDYRSNYRLSKATKYRTECITDEFNDTWFIYLWDGSNHLVVEYQDTVIDSQLTTALEWKNSFIANLEEK